ncbi:MAG: hypothetical protein GY778_22510, partial [bacterium]|nr:hypothetical protein [bacterium]
RDAGYAAGPEGLTDDPSWAMKMFSPFKRAKEEEYLTLMGGVSCTDGQAFKIGNGVSGVTAKATGPLYLFVNDATCYFCPQGAWFFYENNQGKAKITVSNVSAAADR